MPTEASISPADRGAGRGAPGRTDASPVFLAGADRSGTTLLFALLASHPDLCMVRRTNVWRYFDRRYGDLSVPANLDRCLDDMCRYRRMRHLAPERDRIRREFLAGPPTYGRLFALFFEHHAERAGRARWGDKSLHTEHHADRVFAEFPNARIVHMLRDPRDRYASVRRRNGQDLSRVGAATARWMRSARAAARNLERHRDGYLVVRYEDLAREPEPTLRTVCRHIGVAYTPAMFEMEGLPEHRTSGGNSSFGDLEPGRISTRGIGRYREVLRPHETAFIELVARRQLARFGYEPSGIRPTGAARARFCGYDLPVALGRMAGWTVATRVQQWRDPGVPSGRLDPPEAS